MALSRSSACIASAYSVDPISPNSSASQKAKTIERSGVQPDRLQRRQPARDLEGGRKPGARVHAAKTPRVVVGAEHNPAVGIAARDLRDHVADRTAARVHLHVEPHCDRSGAESIRERQRALESRARGHGGPVSRDRIFDGLFPREHHGGNLGQRWRGRRIERLAPRAWRRRRASADRRARTSCTCHFRSAI